MIALARRYRPKRFSDLLVQDHVVAVLRGAVARGRVGHGYLLTGPRGVGKTTAARILAMALNCPDREASGEPCGECENCVLVWNGSANIDCVSQDDTEGWYLDWLTDAVLNPDDASKLPTILRWARSSTSTISAIGRPRWSLPAMRTAARSPCST